MSIKLVDSLQSMGDFPVAFANSIECADGTDLETKLSTLGTGGGVTYVQLSQEEYDNLEDSIKLDGREFRTYDTGHIYKLGIEYGKDGVQISDNETVEDKTWSSKKTSDEIAKVESELSASLGEKADMDKVVPKITITDTTTADAKTIIEKNWSTFPAETSTATIATSNYGYNALINKQGKYGTVTLTTPVNGEPLYYGVLGGSSWTWKELATMDKVALKQEHFDKKVKLTDSNWKYAKIPFTKSYMNTPSVNVSCGDYLNPEFYSYWGCEAYIININNKGCTIRYRSSKASESEPLEVSIIVFVNGI